MLISNLMSPKSASGALVAMLLVCGSVDAKAQPSPYHEPPERHVFDGVTDDLLTAGLGVTGLTQQPGIAEPSKLSEWRDRRRRAIWQSWRALVDLRRWAYGSEARIAGVEYVAHVKASERLPESSFLLQIPASFDPNKPCLLVTAASGSRGIFGSLPTVGQWGLRQGCAVVSDDKGLGMRVTDPTGGWRLTASGHIEPIARAASPFPHALQMAHAHASFESEPHWGRLLLRAGKLALQLLAAEYPERAAFTAENTLIIAAGISNGGAAVLQALEADDAQFIDAAVASEPNVHLAGAPALYDYATLHAMLQPCAILAENLTEAPLGIVVGMNLARHTAWCERLAQDGLVSGSDVTSRASNARQRLLQSGIEPAALRLGAVNLQFGLWTSVAATYAQTYLRRGLNEPACGISFTATDASGQPRELQVSERAALFSDGTGIAPTAGINIVARDAAGGLSNANASSYDTARCLRSLSTDISNVTQSLIVRGRTGQRPVIVLHGGGDALIPIAHTSRRYASLATARNPKFRFLEIANGQHFDAFLAIPGMEPAFVPMQPFVDRSLDDVQAFLTEGKALPASGILR